MRRYGEKNSPDGIIWNDTVEMLVNHRSVRHFLADDLPSGALETMVAAAQSSSSSSNLHHWSVVAVTDPAMKQQLLEFSRSKDRGSVATAIAEAPTVLLWVADHSRNHDITVDNGGQPDAYQYLDSFTMATVDTAIAAQNAAVAAESIGLGIVFLGVMRNHAQELADFLRLPPRSYVTFGMAVGRPDPARMSSIRPRPAQGVVLHHNHYGTPPEGWIADYEEAFSDFRDRAGLQPRSWASAVTHGTGSSYMDGRENLSEAVTRQGFGLA